MANNNTNMTTRLLFTLLFVASISPIIQASFIHQNTGQVHVQPLTTKTTHNLKHCRHGCYLEHNVVANDYFSRLYNSKYDDNTEVDNVIKTTNQPITTPPSSPLSINEQNSPPKSIALLLPLLLLTITTTTPQITNAIDLPNVDILSLSIPVPIPDIRYFIAGGLCAAASHGVTTPIDVVKTRMQSEPETYTSGLLSATTSIIQKDGPSVLLKGLGPTVVGYGVEGAMKFGLYESLKPITAALLSSGGNSNNQAASYLVASIVAGAVASLLLCPMERVRIKLVTDQSFASGLITGLPRLIEEEGFLSIFSGMPAMLSKQVPYTITKQVSFDIFAGLLYTAAAANFALSASEVKAEVSVIAAFLASILSCITSHPGDVILTRTYKGGGGGGGENSNGFTAIVSELYQENGVGAFFTGLSARFLHVGAIITSQLVLYDVIKQLLGLPATGSQ